MPERPEGWLKTRRLAAVASLLVGLVALAVPLSVGSGTALFGFAVGYFVAGHLALAALLVLLAWFVRRQESIDRATQGDG